jgi:hypothetical protein
MPNAAKRAQVVVTAHEKLRFKLPYSDRNREIIKAMLPKRSQIRHTGSGWWECAPAHSQLMIERLAEDHEVRVRVRVSGRQTAEICDVRCQEALGPECECACAGQYHGVRSPGWRSVGMDSNTLVRHGPWTGGYERVYVIPCRMEA